MQPFASAGIAVVAMTSANAVLPRIVFMKELLSCKPIHGPSTGSWITTIGKEARQPRRSARRGRRREREPPTAKALAEKGRKKRKRPLLDLG